jgi:hypothetical protein
MDYSSTTVPTPRYRPHGIVVYHIATVLWFYHSTTVSRYRRPRHHGPPQTHNTTIPNRWYRFHGLPQHYGFMTPAVLPHYWGTGAIDYSNTTGPIPRYLPHGKVVTHIATVPWSATAPRSHGTVDHGTTVHNRTTIPNPRYRLHGSMVYRSITVPPRCCHTTATVPPSWYCRVTATVPRCRFQGTSTVPPRYRPNGIAKVPTFQSIATVPTLVVLPRYRQGIAPMVLPRYLPSKVLPRYRPSWYCPGTARVWLRWYLPRYRFQNTATASPRYCRGLATVTSP